MIEPNPYLLLKTNLINWRRGWDVYRSWTYYCTYISACAANCNLTNFNLATFSTWMSASNILLCWRVELVHTLWLFLSLDSRYTLVKWNWKPGEHIHWIRMVWNWATVKFVVFNTKIRANNTETSYLAYRYDFFSSWNRI